MQDPLESIFGMGTRQLFRAPELVASHGALERLPAFMYTGALTSVDALCREYTGSVEVAQGSTTNGLQFAVNGAHPYSLLTAGLTVYFQDMKRHLPASAEWLQALEASLGVSECARIMAFANAKGSGLTLHHDRYDQLFFQIRGEKLFRYAPNRYLTEPDTQFSPINGSAPEFAQRYRHGYPLTCEEVLQQPFTTLELKPGSAFFMPAGTWHTTADQQGEALSLAVAIRTPSRLDVLLNLLSIYAGQEPKWRERCYGAWSSDAAARAEAEAAWQPLLADLAERLPKLPMQQAPLAWTIQSILNGQASRFPRDARFERFVRLPNSSLEFADDPAGGKLRCTVSAGPNHRPQARTTLGIEPDARVIMEWVAKQSAVFTVTRLRDAFSDFAPEDIDELLSWLAQAGLVRPLPAPEWDG